MTWPLVHSDGSGPAMMIASVGGLATSEAVAAAFDDVERRFDAGFLLGLEQQLALMKGHEHVFVAVYN